MPEELVVLEEEELSRLQVHALRRLGGGSGGRVFVGTLDGTDVAVKIIHPTLSRRADLVAAFLKEAHLLARVPHSNIIRILAVCHLPPAFCGLPTRRHTWGLVLELAKHGPVAGIIRSCQPTINPQPAPAAVQTDPAAPRTQASSGLTVKFAEPVQPPALYSDATAVGWCLDVARALDFLHRQQPPVIHRDIKPDNILLVEGPGQAENQPPLLSQARAKLADFGMAQVLDWARPVLQQSPLPAVGGASCDNVYLMPGNVHRSLHSHVSARSASASAVSRRPGRVSDMVYGISGSPGAGGDGVDRRSPYSSAAGAGPESPASSLARRLSSFIRPGAMDAALAASSIATTVPAGGPNAGGREFPGDGTASPAVNADSPSAPIWQPSCVGPGEEADVDDSPRVVALEGASRPGYPLTPLSPTRKKSTLGLASKAGQGRLVPARSVSQAVLHSKQPFISSQPPPSRASSSVMDNGMIRASGRSRTQRQSSDDHGFHMLNSLQHFSDRPTAHHVPAMRYSSTSGVMPPSRACSSSGGMPAIRTDASVLAAALQIHISTRLSNNSTGASSAGNGSGRHGAVAITAQSSVSRKHRSSRTSFTNLPLPHSAHSTPPQDASTAGPQRMPSRGAGSGSMHVSMMPTRPSHTGRAEGKSSPHSSRPSPNVFAASQGPSFTAGSEPSTQPLTSMLLAAATKHTQPQPDAWCHQYLEGAAAVHTTGMHLADRDVMRTHSMLSRTTTATQVELLSRLSDGQQELHDAAQPETTGSGPLPPCVRREPHSASQMIGVFSGSKDSQVPHPGIAGLEGAGSGGNNSSGPTADPGSRYKLRSTPASFSNSGSPLAPQGRVGLRGPRDAQEPTWPVGPVRRSRELSRDVLVPRVSQETLPSLLTQPNRPPSSRPTHSSMTAVAGSGTWGEGGAGALTAQPAAGALIPAPLPHRHSSSHAAFTRDPRTLLRKLAHALPQPSSTDSKGGAEEGTGTLHSAVHTPSPTVTSPGNSSRLARVILLDTQDSPVIGQRLDSSQGGASNLTRSMPQQVVPATLEGAPGGVSTGASNTLLAHPSGAGARLSSVATSGLLTESEVNGWMAQQLDSQPETLYALTGGAGTLLYMAPEVAREELYNEKSDVYSFAIVMYELLGRTLLLAGRTRTEVDYLSSRIQSGYRPRRAEHIDHDGIWQLIVWCWAQDASLRPSMAQVVQRLVSIHQELTEADARTSGGATGRMQRLRVGLGGASSFKSSRGTVASVSQKSRTSRIGNTDDRTSAATSAGLQLGLGPSSNGAALGGNEAGSVQGQEALDSILEPPQTRKQPACCGCIVS